MALSLCGYNAVAEDHDGLGGGVALDDGHRRSPVHQIFANEAVCWDGVDIRKGIACARHFRDGESTNRYGDK